MKFIIVWVALAATMLTVVLVLRPTQETIALCLLAWFGGVASSLAAQAVGRISNNKQIREVK